MSNLAKGKLRTADERLASWFRWIPWLSFLVIWLPVPLIFFLLFLAATSTESAAIYFLLSLVSLGVSTIVGALVTIILLLYRQRWLAQLRNRLAADGITAAEVRWFTSELTSAERAALEEIERANPLLADAYRETLASRLTATRIVTKVKGELLKVQRRIGRARALVGPDTSSLLKDLESDRKQLEELKHEATSRLSEAKTRLQVIEASAGRSMNQNETRMMLQRLSAAQNHLPLAIEMAENEREAMRAAEVDLVAIEAGKEGKSGETPRLDHDQPNSLKP